jgi:superfamily II RNA helicase
MPTKKPSVTAYLDSALFERLLRYQKAKGLKTLSKAANLALKEFFEMLAVREQEEEKETLANVKRELSAIRSEFDRRIEEVTEKLRRIEEQQSEESED